MYLKIIYEINVFYTMRTVEHATAGALAVVLARISRFTAVSVRLLAMDPSQGFQVSSISELSE